MISFAQAFQIARQDTIARSRQENQLVYSVGVFVTGMMAAAALAYPWLPWLSVTFLCMALVLMWGRQVILRQVRKDLAEMLAAQDLYEKGDRQPAYPEFVLARSRQLLADNKALTARARELISGLEAWAHNVKQPA